MRPAVAGNEGKDRIGRTGDSGGTATPGRQFSRSALRPTPILFGFATQFGPPPCRCSLSSMPDLAPRSSFAGVAFRTSIGSRRRSRPPRWRRSKDIEEGLRPNLGRNLGGVPKLTVKPSGSIRRGMHVADHVRRFPWRHRILAEIGAPLAAALAGVLRSLVAFVGHCRSSAVWRR